MLKEKEHLGREIFVAGYDGDLESGELGMFDSISDLNNFLSSMSPVSETNLTVLHGILTSAEYIPEDIGAGAHVVVVDPRDEDNGCVYEFIGSDADGLVKIIEELMSETHKDLGDLTIDNIFILYGYEMSMCYAVNEEEVDEQAIEDSQKIAESANKMREKIS
jgi:hypothetical protein